MNPSLYPASNDLLRLLVQGAPGSGKSVLLSQFPAVRVIDLDVNYGGVLRYCDREKRPHNIIDIDFVDRNDKGDAIAPPEQYNRLNELLLRAQADPKCETIGLDSGTNLADLLVVETLRKQNKSFMTKQEWGFYATYGKMLMNTLTSIRKHVVITIHEKINKDEKGNVVYPVKITWPGQIGERLGMYFTNVWRTKVKQVFLPNGSMKPQYLVETNPSNMYELKNTLGLPSEFEFTWDVVAQALKGTK